MSSIGDIILTTPIIRTLRQKFENAEIHFLVKDKYKSAIITNNNIDKFYFFNDNLNDLIYELKKEKYDIIFDLHNNLRSRYIVYHLDCNSYSFPKKNISKFLITVLKKKIKIEHVVIRYAEVLKALGISLDEGGLEFSVLEENSTEAKALIKDIPYPRISLVLGASYPTKRWTLEHYTGFINICPYPVLLLGGPGDADFTEKVMSGVKSQSRVLNFVGQTDLNLTAALMGETQAVITPDTGLMHIAAALQVPIISLWGNTAPIFGMTPYKAQHLVLEVEGLRCRPCSKLGFDACPKRHFKCMTELKPELVLHHLNELLISNQNH